MRYGRFCLVCGGVLLVIASLTGCLQITQSEPLAMFTASLTTQEVPFTTNFDGTLSHEDGADIVQYLWTFGDGGAETGPIVSHTYVEDGTYEVQLTVIDSSGVSSIATMQVNALNPAPTAGFTYSPRSSMGGAYYFICCSETVTFDASEMCSDDGSIVSYDWYFGYRNSDNDPVTAAGEVVTHEFLYAGTYTVILTVTDNDGGETEYSEEVIVEGSQPCYPDTQEGGGCTSWTCGG